MATTKERPPRRCPDHRARRVTGCTPCQTYDNWYSRTRRQMAKAGTWSGLTPVDQVAEHVDRLYAAGWTSRTISDRSGVSMDHIQDIKRRLRSRGVQAATVAALLAVTGDPPTTRYVSAIGTQRRIRALLRLGWSRAHIGEFLGVKDRAVAEYLSAPTVTRITADRVAAAYAELSMTPGPSPITRGKARAAGYPPPLAWDDESIDDPAAVPAADVREATRHATEVDPERVSSAVRGMTTRRELTTAELVDVIRVLAGRGYRMTDERIAAHLRWLKSGKPNREAVTRVRLRNDILPAEVTKSSAALLARAA